MGTSGAVAGQAAAPAFFVEDRNLPERTEIPQQASDVSTPELSLLEEAFRYDNSGV